MLGLLPVLSPRSLLLLPGEFPEPLARVPAAVAAAHLRIVGEARESEPTPFRLEAFAAMIWTVLSTVLTDPAHALDVTVVLAL